MSAERRQGSLHFDGRTYDPEFDSARLTGQLRVVYQIMRDGRWRTLAEVGAEAQRSAGRHYSEASISARLRDLRKADFGGFILDRRRRGDSRSGLFEYRLEI